MRIIEEVLGVIIGGGGGRDLELVALSLIHGCHL